MGIGMSEMIGRVTRMDVMRALERVETGATSVEDANLIRSYLRMLESWIENYTAKQDGEDGEN
jgi:hypothetical protein